MIRVRPLGNGCWLVQLDTALGPLTLLVNDRAAMGNLYVWLKEALIQRLADDLLEKVARTTRAW